MNFGINATRDDIQDLMREMDRRFDMMVTELADQRRVTSLLKKFFKQRLDTMGEQIADVHGFLGEMRDWMNTHD